MTLGRVHLAILRGAALLVPVSERAEWFAEWSAELWYVNQNPTVFCLGSFRDAFWLNRNRAKSVQHTLRLESPFRCVVVLSIVAALGYLSSGIPSGFAFSRSARESIAIGCFWIYFLSFLMLAAAAPLGLGEHPANRYAPGLAIRMRRWGFLAIKITLLAPLVMWWSCAAGSFVPPFAPLLLFLGLMGAFRWALADQRRRCPVCLHVLSNPAQIGDPSRVIFGWHGTELVCSRGHGLLYVPAAPTSWYSTQRWQYLDPSWSSLFS